MKVHTGSGSSGADADQGWHQLLSRAVREVFETAAGMVLSPCEDGAGEVNGEITAIIGVAGNIDGVLSVRCDEATACAVSSHLPGAHEQGAAGGGDALGEVCAMVARNFKGRLGEAGRNSVLSVPTVIYGRSYLIRPLVKGGSAACRMWMGSGLIDFRIDYRIE